MQQDVTVGLPDGGSKSIGVIEHQDPPQGFQPGASGLGLDWIELPADLAAKVAPLMRLTGGYRDVVGDVEVVRFAERVGGKVVMARVEGRPELAEALAWLTGFVRAKDAMRQAHWAKEREERQAAQRAQVPEGQVYLRFVGSEDDGWSEVWLTPDGGTVRDVALAGGQRAETGMGDWAYATPEAISEAIARGAERDRKRVERKAARERAGTDDRAALLAEVVPEHALAAYCRYGGNAEQAWERGDEMAYVSINRWDLAIEAQGLAAPSLARWHEDDLAETSDRTEEPLSGKSR